MPSNGERISRSSSTVSAATEPRWGGAAWRFFRELSASAPGRSALAVALLLLAGVTEAFGLLLIVPLLQVAGLADAVGEPGSAVRAVAEVAAQLGVPTTLPGVLAFFLGLVAVRAIVAWWRAVLLVRLRVEFIDRIRAELHAAVAGASWMRLLELRRSDIHHILTDEVRRVGAAALLVMQMAVGGTLAFVHLAVAVAVAPKVAGAAVLLGIPLALAGWPALRRSHTLGARLTGTGRSLRGLVTDFLDGLKPAKGHNAEPTHLRRIERETAAARESQVAFAKLGATTRAGLQLTAAAGLAGLVWYGLSDGRLALAELTLLTIVFARATPAALNLIQQAEQLINALPAYASAMGMRDALRAGAEEPVDRPGVDAPVLSDSIEVRGLTFTYPGENAPALVEVNCRIAAHGMTAITGPSGSGKSTLADLLLGLLRPTDGGIFVDGAPLTQGDLRRWRASAAYVAQEPFLLHDTVRANLRWHRAGAVEADMWRALRLADAADFVAALPHGLDTAVGDRGQRLSGGERQRVALAGAMLREPALLVLDEPASQLDAASEARLATALRGLRGRTTVIAVVHGGELLKLADRVIVLHAGRIEAFGT